MAYTAQGISYPAFQLNFYLDNQHTKIWNTSFTNKTFEIARSGKVGVDTDAKVTLTVNSDIPQQLYYKFDTVDESDVPLVKSGIVTDTDVTSYNQINVKESLYNGRYAVSVAATNSFNYYVEETPERVSYAGLSPNYLILPIVLIPLGN